MPSNLSSPVICFTAQRALHTGQDSTGLEAEITNMQKKEKKSNAIFHLFMINQASALCYS